MKKEFSNPMMNISLFEKEDIVTESALDTVDNALKTGDLRVNGQDISDKIIVKMTF